MLKLVHGDSSTLVTNMELVSIGVFSKALDFSKERFRFFCPDSHNFNLALIFSEILR